MGTWLQLQEVYGIADKVKTETGMTTDVFRALLAMEMMTVFFIHDFLQPFAKSFEQCGSGVWTGHMRNRCAGTWVTPPQLEAVKAFMSRRMNLW